MSPRDWLAHLEQFGVKLGLTSIRAILDELGRPELDFQVIHVAGTNGKGSVSAMVARGLLTSGTRIGLYTSPHLVRLEERFRIDGRPVEPSLLDLALSDVRRAVRRLRARGVLDVEPTYFEATTATAFQLFSWKRVGVAVIEVGLGGRLDATNVVSPCLTAITSIDFDHEAQLGSTLSAIAAEKAGIIKDGVPVVAGDLPEDALAVIAAVAVERNARLVGAAPILSLGVLPDGHEQVDVTLDSMHLGPLRLSLAGRHQVDNAGIAARLLYMATATCRDVRHVDVVAALTTTRWPARLETVVTSRGRAVVDGAHNPAGARALASYLTGRHPAGLPVVFGAMRDKALAGMVAALAPVARPLVCTRAPGARAATADELAAVARGCAAPAVEIRDELDAALDCAWEHGQEIAVAGSLFLAGAVLARLGVPVD